MTHPTDPSTTVALVGAGPGDPELLTLAAEAALAHAHAVVTDPACTDLARAFAPQAELLVAEGVDHVRAALLGSVQAEHRVVRLYAGDPWLHPAHAAEVAALVQAGVAHTTVPGVVPELAEAAATSTPIRGTTWRLGRG